MSNFDSAFLVINESISQHQWSTYKEVRPLIFSAVTSAPAPTSAATISKFPVEAERIDVPHEGHVSVVVQGVIFRMLRSTVERSKQAYRH